MEVRANPGDGRSTLLFLTAEGRAFVGRAAECPAPALEEVDGRHGLEDRRQGLERLATLLPELRALHETLDAMRDGAPAPRRVMGTND